MIASIQASSAVEIATEWILGRVEILGGKRLRPYQRYCAFRIVRSVLLNEGREITLLWCRQIGKTEMGMLMIATLMALLPHMARDARYLLEFPILREYRFGFFVGFIAPKLDTARIPFKRLRRLLRGSKQTELLRSLGITIDTASSQELALSNGSYALALSGAETAFQEGHTLHLLWFEETQAIGQYQIHKVFAPMIASTNGTAVKVGTAGTKKCSFLDSIEANVRLNNGDHSEITWKDAIAIMRRESPGDPWTDRYEAYVRKQIERLPAGELSETFRMNYDLEWILALSQLIAFAEWQKLCADGLNGRPFFRRGEFTDRHRRIFGIDVGKVNDPTVITAGEEWDDHIRWLDWCELKGIAYDDQLETAVPWMAERGCLPQFDPRVIVDSTGVGDPMTDFYRSRLPGVRGLRYDAQSKDTLYKLWQARLPSSRRGAGVLYPPCADDIEFKRFELQFLNCEVEAKGNLVSYHHPDRDDEDLGSEVQHDDYVDSGFNVLYGANQPVARVSSVSIIRHESQCLKPEASRPADPKVDQEQANQGAMAALAASVKGATR